MKSASFTHRLGQGWVGLPDQYRKLDSPNTVVMAFCSPIYHKHPEVLVELAQMFPNAKILGCSTSGEIAGAEIHDLSISVGLIQLEEGSVRASRVALAGPDQSYPAGVQIAKELKGAGLRAILVLSDGLQVNGSALIAGINQELLDSSVMVAGGLAGDGSHFKSTWLVSSEGKIESGAVMAVGLYGESLVVHQSSKGGWDIFGPERQVTRSRGNVLFEVDGRPALDLYKEYLGEKAKDLPASGLHFPLQIRETTGNPRKLVRTVLEVDEKAKSVTFAGDIPEGCLGQFMRANFERVIDAASSAAELITQSSQGVEADDAFVIAISCVGRRMVLGVRAEEETEALSEGLPTGSRVVGFYSYGELGATLQDGPCDLHNQTMTLFSVSEKKASKMKKAG